MPKISAASREFIPSTVRSTNVSRSSRGSDNKTRSSKTALSFPIKIPPQLFPGRQSAQQVLRSDISQIPGPDFSNGLTPGAMRYGQARRAYSRFCPISGAKCPEESLLRNILRILRDFEVPNRRYSGQSARVRIRAHRSPECRRHMKMQRAYRPRSSSPWCNSRIRLFIYIDTAAPRSVGKYLARNIQI